MNCILASLFCISLIVAVNGAWLKPRTSIDEDAMELTPLVEKFWSLTPDVFKRAVPLVYCQVIDQCCAAEDRTEAISLMKDFVTGPYYRSRFSEIIQTCMNSTGSNKANQLCSSVVRSIVPSEILLRHSDVTKYTDIIKPFENALNSFLDPIETVCNGATFHSLICSTGTKLVQGCISEILQKIYDDDYKSYQSKTLNMKKVFTTLSEQLSEAFIKDANSI